MSAPPKTVRQQSFIYTSPPGSEEVTAANYELRRDAEWPVPELQPGELLYRAEYLSVDPYMRIQQASSDTWEKPHALDSVQGGGVVGRVVAVAADGSCDGKVAVGDAVYCYSGWQLYTVRHVDDVRVLDAATAPVSTALGCLGMPGRTAYFGLLEAGRPVAGDVCVVSGAAGAVGSLVVQIAKLKGCTTIAFAGSDAKCAYLRDVLGVDHALNYKDYNDDYRQVMTALTAVAPDGIDVYFDNVGGCITDAVMQLIRLRARVVICGQISQYQNLDELQSGPRFLHRLIYTRASITGVLARDYTTRQSEMEAAMGAWIRDGKLKYRETVHEGFTSLPSSLNSLFHGANTGKLLVHVAATDEEDDRAAETQAAAK